MAICKMCHKMIPDGRDFCDECEMKRANQADESYLDRLLSSVSSESDPEPRRKRNEPVREHDERPSMADIFAEVIAEEKENRETNEYPQFEDNTVGEDVVFDAPVDEETEFDAPVDEETEFDAPVDEETEFDAPVDEEIGFDSPADEETGFDSPVNEENVFEVSEDEPEMSPVSDNISSFGDNPPNEIDSMITDLLSEMPDEDPNTDEETLDPDDIADIFSQQENASAEPVDDEGLVDVTDVDAPDITDIDAPDITDVDVPDITDADEPDITDADEPDITDVDVPDITDVDGLDITDVMPESDDSADMLSFDGTEMVDPFGGDISPADESSEPEIQFVNPGEDNVEENLLGADDLFALDDSTISEQDIVSIGDDEQGPIDVMAEIESGVFEDKIKALDAPTPAPEAKKKKKSLFQKLFGNVVEELTEEQKEERRRKAEEEEKQKAAILETRKKNAEEAKAAKAAQKEIDKAEAEEKKKQAEEAKRKAREEAREKARKKKEAREALEISEEDEGKINKVGAGILFILFAVITLFIILGTNTYTYKLSIENAQTDFLIKHYNDAYYDVYGLQIKDEDIELYDRIMTVMYVNSQLNSYNYYMKSNNKDKALNSLIKGLEKYEKYYMLATTLGITDDLEYVKTNILNELNRTFKVTEAEAYSMMNINDVIDYSEYIYALLGTYDLDSIKSLA